MSERNRREFLKASAIGAAGFALNCGGGNRPDAPAAHAPAARPAARATDAQQTGILELTLAGFCLLVKRSDTKIDVLLPAVMHHHAELRHPAGTLKVAHHSLEISGLAEGAVSVDRELLCGTHGRWLAKLTTLNPRSALIDYPEKDVPNADRRIASHLSLTDGSISLPTTADPTTTPGWNGVWTLTWGSTSVEQLLVHQVVFRRRVPAGELTIVGKPMNSGQPDISATVQVAAGQTVSVMLRNDMPGDCEERAALVHIHGYTQAFKDSRSGALEAVTSNWCEGKPPAWAGTRPSPQMLSALDDARRRKLKTFQFGTQRFSLTACDPICPVAYYDPSAEG